MGGHVVVGIEGGVATVTLANEQEQNRLTQAMLEQLLSFCAEMRSNPAVHVVIVTGAGSEVFSTGLLTPQLKADLGKEGVMDLVRLANRVFDAIEELPQIVVTAVNGIVRAGAVELMLACDMRIAADHCRLSMPEARWGCFPGAGAPVRLPVLIGGPRALDLICTGREIDARTMERMGIVERLVEGGNLHSEVRAFADVLASNGPAALRGAKQIARIRQRPGFEEARALSDRLRHEFEWSADADEGIEAHLAGRRPVFTGR
ncbi:MAG: enoyl-CoA hydratase/isomerase family protein [Rhizobiaceae bacterium]